MMKRKGFTLVELLVILSIVLILTAIFAPVVIGYGKNERSLEYGEVVDKWYEESSTVYITSGNVSIPVETPEKWYIKIENSGKTDTFAVDLSEWNKYDLGDNYPYEG